MKQQKNIFTIIQEAKTLLGVKEDESTWLKMHNTLTALTVALETKEESTFIVEKAADFIIKTLLSDRSRLSLVSFTLLNKIVKLQDDLFNGALFLSTLFKLVNKPNKVFNMRAEETLLGINDKVILKNISFIKEQYNSVNRNVRRVVIRLLIKVFDLLSQENKNIIDKAKNDNCGEVRKLAKDFSSATLIYSPMKKAVKKEEIKEIKKENKSETNKKININELIFELPKEKFTKEIINKLIKDNKPKENDLIKEKIENYFLKDPKIETKPEEKENISVTTYLEGINKILREEIEKNKAFISHKDIKNKPKDDIKKENICDLNVVNEDLIVKENKSENEIKELIEKIKKEEEIKKNFILREENTFELKNECINVIKEEELEIKYEGEIPEKNFNELKNNDNIIKEEEIE